MPEQNGKALADLVGNRFVIASPHLNVMSNWIEQSAALNAILDKLIEHYRGDSTRIYVTGFSRGGYGTWDFAAKYKDRVAAIMPISGGAISVDDVSIFEDLSVWVVHGIGDPIVPYRWAEEAVKSIDAVSDGKFFRIDNAAPSGDAYLRSKHIFTSYDNNGHDAWSETYRQPQIYTWLLRQKSQARLPSVGKSPRNQLRDCEFYRRLRKNAPSIRGCRSIRYFCEPKHILHCW